MDVEPETQERKGGSCLSRLVLLVLIVVWALSTYSLYNSINAFINVCFFDKDGQTGSARSGTASTSTGDSAGTGGSGSANGSAGTAGDSSSSAGQASAQPAQILESGYFITRKGNVEYGVVWQNPNEGCSIYAPTLLVVGRDAEGNELFRDTVKRPVKMRPGERQIIAGGVTENKTALQDVDFYVAKNESKYITGEKAAEEYLTFSNLQESDADAYSKTFTCTLAANKLPGDADGLIFYDVLLRDEQGKIVFGSSAIDSNHSEGMDVPAAEGESAECQFKVGTPDLFGGVPEHASFEVGATLGCDLSAYRK